jgi:hypothetical protein
MVERAVTGDESHHEGGMTDQTTTTGEGVR